MYYTMVIECTMLVPTLFSKRSAHWFTLVLPVTLGQVQVQVQIFFIKVCGYNILQAN